MTSHIDNTNPRFAGKSIPKIIIQLSWPAILEQFLICMANLADTAMVGSIGPAATASVAINISSVWLINGFITALSAGFSYLVSHAIGEGNKTKVESAVRQSLTAAILLGFFLTLIVFSIHQKLPVWLGAAPEVLPGATAYMGIFSLGLIGETLGVVLSADLRSAGNTRIPLAANLTSNLFNLSKPPDPSSLWKHIRLGSRSWGKRRCHFHSLFPVSSGSHPFMGNIPDPDTCKTHPERKLPVSKAIAPSVVSYQFSCHDGTQHPMYGSGSPHSHDLRSWYLTSGCPLPYQPDRRTSLSARIWLFLLCYCPDRPVLRSR